MQTSSISTLSLTTMTVAADASASAADFAGGKGADAPFAALLQRRDETVVDEAAAGVAPEPVSEIDPLATLLPVFAATGKILPTTGKLPISLPSAEEETRDEDVVSDDAIPALPITLLRLTFPGVEREILPAGENDAVSPRAKIEGAEYVSVLGPAVQAPAIGDVGLIPAATPVPEITTSVRSRPASILKGAALPDTPRASDVEMLSDAQPVARPDRPIDQTKAVSPTAPVATPPAQQTGPAAQIAVSISATPRESVAENIRSAIQPDQAAVAGIVTRGQLPADVAGKTPAMEAASQSIATQSASSTTITPADVATAAHPEPRQQQEERPAARHEKGADSAAAVLRPSSLEVPAPVPAAATVSADRSTIAAPLAPAPTFATAMPDRAEAVASVVDRLVAAREAGMTSLASVALGHRDFGEITVSFASKGNGLEVSVAAADDDNQRALAAALHAAERPMTREPASPPAQTASSTHATGTQDRGAEGQFARNSGERHSRGETANDQHRPASPRASTADTDAPAPGRDGIYV